MYNPQPYPFLLEPVRSIQYGFNILVEYIFLYKIEATKESMKYIAWVLLGRGVYIFRGFSYLVFTLVALLRSGKLINFLWTNATGLSSVRLPTDAHCVKLCTMLAFLNFLSNQYSNKFQKTSKT